MFLGTSRAVIEILRLCSVSKKSERVWLVLSDVGLEAKILAICFVLPENVEIISEQFMIVGNGTTKNLVRGFPEVARSKSFTFDL